MRFKWGLFIKWSIQQVLQGTWFENVVKKRRVKGIFSIHSHIRQSTGKPKIGYSTEESAKNAAKKMMDRTGKRFHHYLCFRCGKYHIGKNRFDV